MFFLFHFIFILILFVAIIYVCNLFTNAIEHFGSKLKLGNNALGAVCAVVGTSLPETIVPLVAIFGAMFLKTDLNISKDIALGAIIGSPFILSTLALFLSAVTIIILYLSKKRDKLELNIDSKNALREYKYFIITYSLVIFLGIFSVSHNVKLTAAFFLILLYFFFVIRTIKKSKYIPNEETIEELIFSKVLKNKKTSLFLIFLQIIVSLILLVIFSHLFVNQIKYFAEFLNINPILLSLVITPIATELPECVNSIIWIKNNKDDLAISNILGAIVFQAMIPSSIGLILTPWVFDKVLIINALLVLICALLSYISILIFKRFRLEILLFCGTFYFIYLIFIKLI